MILLIFFITTIVVGHCFSPLKAILEKADHQVTPLGWQFKYKWLQLEAIGILMVIGIEL